MGRWVWNIGLGLALVACGHSPSVDAFAAAEPLAARMLEAGTSSQLDTQPGATHEYVIDSDAQWKAFYASHRPNGTPPAVDFTHERVVGVELARPTGGYTVGLVEVAAADPAGTQVTYTESKPSPDAVVIQVLTQPYFFAAVPLRPGPVSFKHLTIVR